MQFQELIKFSHIPDNLKKRERENGKGYKR